MGVHTIARPSRVAVKLRAYIRRLTVHRDARSWHKINKSAGRTLEIMCTWKGYLEIVQAKHMRCDRDVFLSINRKKRIQEITMELETFMSGIF